MAAASKLLRVRAVACAVWSIHPIQRSQPRTARRCVCCSGVASDFIAVVSIIPISSSVGETLDQPGWPRVRHGIFAFTPSRCAYSGRGPLTGLAPRR